MSCHRLGARWLRTAVLDLDLHEGRHLSTADGALIRLHAHYLRALDAQAHVAARQHHSVLGGREADDALSLGLVGDVCRGVIHSVDVVHVEDSVVVLCV